MSEKDLISLTVLTPEKTILEKRVSKVELPGTKGRFMVLHNHEPLISSLEEGRIVYESEGVEGKVDVVSGFVEIHDNKVIACVE